jgi:hypothetical protein
MNRETAEAWVLGSYGLAQGVVKEYVAPVIKEARPSTLAWLGLIAGVATYDVLSKPNETMSERYVDFVDEHPVIAWGAVIATSAHLLGKLPEKIDPIHQLAEFVKR